MGPASPPPAPVDAPSRDLAATHEAGHAVAAIACNILPLRATTVPDPERGNFGSVTYSDDPPPSPAPAMGPTHWPALEDFMVVALAACCATARERGEAPASQRGWQADYNHARELAELRGVHGHEMGAYLNWIRVRSETLIDAFWPSVLRVAAALRERETLTGAELRELVRLEPDPIAEQRARIASAMAAIAERIPEPAEAAA